MTIGAHPPVIGFAAGSRFLGRAVCRSGCDPEICPVRLARPFDASERVRIGNWVRRSVAKSGAHGVALFIEDDDRPHLADKEPSNALVRTAATELNVPIVEVQRAEVAAWLDTAEPTDAAICRHLAHRFRPRLLRPHPWTSRAAGGSRSELARYWEMPTVALGAVLVALRFFGGTT